MVSGQTPLRGMKNNNRTDRKPAWRLTGFFRHGLVQNVLSLYGVQLASYIVPLITIPYLARVLGASRVLPIRFATVSMLEQHPGRSTRSA